MRVHLLEEDGSVTVHESTRSARDLLSDFESEFPEEMTLSVCIRVGDDETIYDSRRSAWMWGRDCYLFGLWRCFLLRMGFRSHETPILTLDLTEYARTHVIPTRLFEFIESYRRGDGSERLHFDDVSWYVDAAAVLDYVQGHDVLMEAVYVSAERRLKQCEDADEVCSFAQKLIGFMKSEKITDERWKELVPYCERFLMKSLQNRLGKKERVAWRGVFVPVRPR